VLEHVPRKLFLFVSAAVLIFKSHPKSILICLRMNFFLLNSPTETPLHTWEAENGRIVVLGKTVHKSYPTNSWESGT
jgi:hypothetical protein